MQMLVVLIFDDGYEPPIHAMKARKHFMHEIHSSSADPSVVWLIQAGFTLPIARLPELPTPSSSLSSARGRHRLALAGLDHHEARTVEGQLEGLA